MLIGRRVPDPGAPAVALRVQDLDGLLKRMRAAGVQVTSKDGAEVPFSPTIRNIFVEDPNGLNIELFESQAVPRSLSSTDPATTFHPFSVTISGHMTIGGRLLGLHCNIR
jgi:hypothetical protein